MSEIINNSEKRKELLKHMILQLHAGEAPVMVRNRLIDLLQNIPYDEVVEVEQQLIREGLPAEEVLKFCDIHTMVLDGHIDQSGARPVPAGHPVDTMKKENLELERVIGHAREMIAAIPGLKDDQVKVHFIRLHALFNELMDVDKHYQRKEYLLFPYLEKYEITGPPKVMWGKHDEVRELLKAAIQALSSPGDITAGEASVTAGLVLTPALNGISDMIMKEEEILLPMAMDKLSDQEWYAIYQQTMEFGFCLYDPEDDWKPENIETTASTAGSDGAIRLSTGSFSTDELEAIFKTLPVDLTFVDKEDKVKFFSLGPDRIFARNRAIIGRDVRMCHPPSSVHVVDQILSDFRNGKENSAAFWIRMQDKFVHIEYYAVRGSAGEYLGTLEVTQDIAGLRALEGEQRLLSYSK
ncbi:MAG: DUF438 domain-containing protein [Bacteroidota bacterium]